MMLLAGLLAALAVSLLFTPPAGRRLSTLTAVTAAPRRRQLQEALSRGLPWVIGVVSIVIVAAALGGLAGVTLSLALSVVGLTIGWVARAAVRRKKVAARRGEVVRACQIVSGQLRIGLIPAQALSVAAEDCPVIETASAAQRIGGDPAAALRDQSLVEGCDGLATLAAAWSLSQRSGAPMAEVTHLVAEGLRADERIRAMVSTEVASARASGQLLAFLPVIGIAMAAGIGADPKSFLIETLPGQLCVLGAAIFACAGVVWSEVMTSKAQQMVSA